MKPNSTPLVTYLNDARANPDVPLLMADAFTLTLRTGLVLCYTNVEVTFSYNGNTYLGNSILIDGLKYTRVSRPRGRSAADHDRGAFDRHHHRRRAVSAGAPGRLIRWRRDRPVPRLLLGSDRGHRDRIGAVVQGPARRHRAKSGAQAPSSTSIPIWCCSTSTCRATSISRPACTHSTIPAARW